MILDASPDHIIPECEYLPQVSWASITSEDLEEASKSTNRPLNNGRESPGAKTYAERVKELSIPNPVAFRTIRRLPPPAGESNARLGNAYEFFKNLELLSGFWVDTSLPPAEVSPAGDTDVEMDNEAPSIPVHQQIHVRTGTGSQTPPEYRNAILAAFVKLVAYDFGCNVSLPRLEPRLHLTPPVSASPARATSPGVSFPAHISFVYRTPTDRSSARSGIVEGPVAALSPRAQTGFASQTEEILDLCREVIAVLITAQHRAREGASEKKPNPDAWWCHKPRWGGGTGGPIGKEEVPMPMPGNGIDNTFEISDPTTRSEPLKSPSARKKPRKTLSIYDNYRMVRPPSSTWDRKAKYLSIGKRPNADYDDVFLLSSLNHHVSIVRVQVPIALIAELDGGDVGPRQKLQMWRTKWYDLFLVEDRVEAMRCIWGMMAWMMRKLDVENENENETGNASK